MNDKNQGLRETKRIVIVGGGITGLSAGWYIQNKAETAIELLIVEASPFFGGKMTTANLMVGDDQFIVDAGPESFVTRKPEAWQLAQDLGLNDQVVDPGSETKDMYVLDGGIPKRIPLSPPAFIRSDLLTFRGKLRMALEPFMPAKRDWEDESLADFVRRRLGDEALDKMIGPVLAGIYNTDPETQSILTTSPVMREMERENGGLFAGALARMRARRKLKAEGTSPPQFMAFDKGSQVLIDTLVTKLEAELISGTRAVQIRIEKDQFIVDLEDRSSLTADVVVITVPANQASSLLADTDQNASMLLSQIGHENIGTATLVYDSGQIDMPYRINGLMIPRRENRHIDAVTWTSNKPIERSPEGYEMLRIFFGGSDPELVTREKREIISVIRDELDSMLGIQAEPLESQVYCWPDSFPQAHVGHLQLVDQIEAALPEGLYVAGSSYRGIGIPDCIRQAQTAADQVINYLK